ncbi:MAG: hypothetical protein LBO20_01080, partial [Bifidobacteriaceae bacterium]|nr:hypothetical protein [Bifidobacteriaceae bacterium]
MTLWHGKDPELDTTAYSPALATLLERTMERVAERRHRAVTEADLLACAMTTRWEGADFQALDASGQAELRDAAALLGGHLAEGVRTADCLAAFDVVADVGPTEINPFERDAWRDPLPALLESLTGGGVPDLLAALFGAASELSDGDLLASLYDADRLTAAVSLASVGASVFKDGQLDASALTPRAGFLVGRALALAAKAGAAQAGPADLLTAMAAQKDTYTHLVARRAGVTLTNPNVVSWLEGAAKAAPRPGAAPLEPVEAS